MTNRAAPHGGRPNGEGKIMTKLKLPAFAAMLALALPAAAQDSLTVGTEASYAPFAYVLPSGEMTGFDIDITNALCAEMGVECEIVNQSFDGLIPALNVGQIDAIIASMFITPEREEAIAFAGPYYTIPALFVAADDAELELSADGMSGKFVGVQRGTTMADYVTATFPGARVQNYDTIDSALLDLSSGRVDTVFAESVVVQDFLDSPDGEGFATLGEPIYDEEILGSGAGIGLRKEDTELKERFDAALAAIIENGTYQEINEKYVDVSILPQ
jgi:polar amino acid transport system substrate-binding protein